MVPAIPAAVAGLTGAEGTAAGSHLAEFRPPRPRLAD